MAAVTGDEDLSRSRIGTLLDEARGIALGLSTGEAATDETGPANVVWMCETAKDGLSTLPLDKLARWLGFAHAALRHAGGPELEPPSLPGPPAEGPLLHAHLVLIERYADLVQSMDAFDGMGPFASVPAGELSYRLGRVQGDLACRGLVSVREERDFSRPLFHAAYGRTGSVPPTLEGPGSRRG